MEQVSLIISIIALFVSLATFWLTRIRKGSIKMTKPTVIFFGPDGPGAELKKVFIRTLLYSTSERGQYIENMYVRLQRGETTRDFNIWVYGDKDLARGSGLFVGKSGLASNHHYLMPKDGSHFEFSKGSYQLDIFVEQVNEQPRKIYTQHLEIDDTQGKALTDKNAGIYFDWAPNAQTYESHIDSRPEKNPNWIELIKHLDE
jgi:hypothetical protein